MPTTALTATTTPSGYSETGQAITFTAADVANGNHIDSADNIFVVARNVHVSTAYTVTITSQPDSTTGRTGDVDAVSVAAGTATLFQLQSDGWSDSNSQYLINANNTSIEFAWWPKR